VRESHPEQLLVVGVAAGQCSGFSAAPTIVRLLSMNDERHQREIAGLTAGDQFYSAIGRFVAEFPNWNNSSDM
jgi:hypothetical protein